MPDRECVICGAAFTPYRATSKTCSLDCQIRHRRQLTRERARRHYKPRAPRPDTRCETCRARIAAPKSGPMPRWCRACRANREDDRARKRAAVRRCHSCGIPVPEALRKPGKAVCGNCRVDKRERDRGIEQRRRLRKYSLTQEQYDQVLEGQGGRCPGCGTDDPGVKGWCIDHCHRSGKFRALLCNRCNTALGLARDDPGILRALADLAEQFKTAQVG